MRRLVACAVAASFAVLAGCAAGDGWKVDASVSTYASFTLRNEDAKDHRVSLAASIQGARVDTQAGVVPANGTLPVELGLPKTGNVALRLTVESTGKSAEMTLAPQNCAMITALATIREGVPTISETRCG